jgi:hypothetical protein
MPRARTLTDTYLALARELGIEMDRCPRDGTGRG